jgi:hypothetical protein
MLAVSMPNFLTASALVETATKWLATAFSSLNWLSSQVRAEWALVMVSSVVKVFDETMKRVSSALRSCVASTKSVLSTLETKRKLRLRWV